MKKKCLKCLKCLKRLKLWRGFAASKRASGADAARDLIGSFQ
jgi:hypothetical protein